MTEDNELLRLYAEESSEAAFAELTQRHINLVYSAALRQLNGNSHLAEEVSQSVFLDLARKAGSLVRHSSLVAWLFTTTRFIAMNSRRSESRRQAREQASQLPVEQDSDSAWQELSPILDDTLHDLPESDREALLLRFFEDQPFAQIATRWNITDNAARMRVERALEKLRRALEKRGVVASGAGLSALILTRAAVAAPVDLGGRITSKVAVLPSAPFRALTPRLTPRFVAAVAVAFLATAFFWISSKRAENTKLDRTQTQSLVAPTVSPATDTLQNGPETTPTPSLPAVTEASVATSRNSIKISTVNAETDQPMPNVRLELVTWAEDNRQKQTFTTDVQGTATIAFPEKLSSFDLLTRGDGHANKRLLWRPERGDKIPAAYTLRLSQPVQISGTVLDPDGAPLADATVSFGHRWTSEIENTVETNAYRYATAKTDSVGHWQLNCIAPEMLPISSGSAEHPDYVVVRLDLEEQPAEIQSLTNGTHIFRLGRGIGLRGFVRNEKGEPIGGAKISVGTFSSSDRRETQSNENGSFVVANVVPGKSFLSGEAEGYAPKSLAIQIADTDGPYELTLERGKTLHFRLVDPEGQAVNGGSLRLDTLYSNLGRTDLPQPADIQVDFTLTTDFEGRAIWTNAPDAVLAFSPSAKGFMWHPTVVVRPSEEEHVIKLDYALTIRGTVREPSGKPIEHYRIRIGWPERLYGTDKIIPRWSDIDRFLVTFNKSEFEYAISEPVILSPEHLGYFFKFEADGYASILTRLIGPKERLVAVDITLDPVDGQMIRVLDAAGQPVPNAPVIFLPEGRFVHAGADGFKQMLPHDSFPEIRTDSNGQVPFKFDSELTRILVACPAGSANLTREQLSSDHTVQLTPWGNITGRVLRAGVPSAGEMLILVRSENLGPVARLPRPLPPMIFNLDPVLTREDGTFTFTNAPPGESFLILVRHKLSPEGTLIEARHESKTALIVENADPIRVQIELPESDLSKPIPPYIPKAQTHVILGDAKK